MASETGYNGAPFMYRSSKLGDGPPRVRVMIGVRVWVGRGALGGGEEALRGALVSTILSLLPSLP